MSAYDDNPTIRTGAAGGSTRRAAPDDWRSERATDTILLDNDTPDIWAFVVVVKGAARGRPFRLKVDARGSFIGTGSDADVIFDDPAISSRHLCIRLEGAVKKGQEQESRFYAIDLASTNGTKLNGERITKQDLKDGDRIEIGQTVLVFKRV
ncbi:MAG: FHA domain-containing protein [Chloroflexi bacterium]|nr:FHA domain-containing protein [Chloroflexota bacterium]